MLTVFHEPQTWFIVTVPGHMRRVDLLPPRPGGDTAVVALAGAAK